MYPTLGTFIFPVYTYGVFLSLAFLSAIALAVFHGRYVGLTPSRILDLALWFMLSAIAGARVMYILLYPEQFPTPVSWFELNKGGLVFFGGFLFTVLVVIAFAWYQKISLRVLGDLIAPALAWGHAVGRLGCFFNGCCYGRPTTGFFGVVFPDLPGRLARIPTQLFESGFLFVLAVSGSILLRRGWARSLRSGLIWGGYLILYGGFRFVIEFYRDDNRGGFFTPWQLSISQILALVAIGAGILWSAGCGRMNPEGHHDNVSSLED
jgi:phosphatidylglycerol:prolipoprotein diacylglycerol transferase